MRAEPPLRLERKEQIHRANDNQPRNGQRQRRRVADAGNQQRPPRQIDRAEQQQIHRHGAYRQTQSKRIHRQNPGGVGKQRLILQSRAVWNQWNVSWPPI